MSRQGLSQEFHYKSSGSVTSRCCLDFGKYSLPKYNNVKLVLKNFQILTDIRSEYAKICLANTSISLSIWFHTFTAVRPVSPSAVSFVNLHPCHGVSLGSQGQGSEEQGATTSPQRANSTLSKRRNRWLDDAFRWYIIRGFYSECRCVTVTFQLSFFDLS